MASRQSNRQLSGRFVAAVILILILSLAVFYYLMQPPMNELGYMALFLSITAFISVVAGYGAYRLGWFEKSPSIYWTLLIGYLLASGLTFLNVWVTARLMFASQHDLLLATVLLFFAGGIATVLGYFISSNLSERIRSIEQAALQLAGGDMEARAPVSGSDEMTNLSKTFNQMAVQIQAADQKKRELETLRKDLIAWTSHDLQTPLASIQAILEALADGIVDDPPMKDRYLHTARKDVRALSELIDDLFQVAQMDAGGLVLDYESGSLSDLISDTLESFRELANQKGCHLNGLVQGDIDPVVMDTQRIGRVLNNLLSNAIRYTNAGGHIVVKAKQVDEKVLVEVIDEGVGIPNEDLPHVFDRFYRGEKSRNRATGGAGLGLAIAVGIIHAHGGEIIVESPPGEGTRLTFILPRDGPLNV